MSNYYSIDVETGRVKYTKLGAKVLGYKFSCFGINIKDVDREDKLTKALLVSSKIVDIQLYLYEKKVVKSFEQRLLRVFVEDGYEAMLSLLNDKNKYL